MVYSDFCIEKKGAWSNRLIAVLVVYNEKRLMDWPSFYIQAPLGTQ